MPPRSTVFRVRLAPEEADEITRAADRLCPGMAPSTWARGALLAAARGLGRCARCGHAHRADRCEACSCRRFVVEVDRG
jgi:hypothetical protein